MPIVRIAYATPKPQDVKTAARIAEAVREPTVALLRKQSDLVAVVVERIDPAQWFVAGASLAELGKASFSLDIKVTDSTNTKDEKAAFLAAVFAALGRILGPLHEESYILVHDVRADAYGYGGRTQEHRYVAAELDRASRETAVGDAYARYGIR